MTYKILLSDLAEREDKIQETESASWRVTMCETNSRQALIAIAERLERLVETIKVLK